MNLITADFETAYGTEYSLSKISTEDYVNDPRFEIIGVAVKVNDSAAQWFSGPEHEIAEWLAQFDIPNAALLCHHTMFDGLILAQRFGIFPKLYLDTRLMAQVLIKPFSRSVSLDACTTLLKLGQKGTEVSEFKGKWRGDFTPVELAAYGNYCVNDVELTYKLYQFLVRQLPRTELMVMDLTLRMYLQPTLLLDPDTLAIHLNEVQARRAQLEANLPAGVSKGGVVSNEQFAQLLEFHGVTPPKKISPTTGKEAWAFSKTDPRFKELIDEYADSDTPVGMLIAARVGLKSSIEETRTKKLLDIAIRYKRFRVPLLYYAAHTGRYGGTEGLNAQNFPRTDKSRMRYGIIAPPGHVIVAADLSQIEARITAWLARQHDLVAQFKQGDDVYSRFATLLFDEPITRKNKRERFIGKTCILGLGFGMGAIKFRNTLAKDGVKVSEKFAERTVQLYREVYSHIPGLWRYAELLLPVMAHGKGRKTLNCVTASKSMLILPNGVPMIYHKVREENGQWVYEHAGVTKYIWGGKLVENIVQALARTIIIDNMLEIYRQTGRRPALQVHDELDYVVPVDEVGDFEKALHAIMTKPPEWGQLLPVGVEISHGPTFGDVK